MNRAAFPALLALLLTATGIVLVWLAMSTEPAISVPPSPVVIERTVVSERVVVITATPSPYPTRQPTQPIVVATFAPTPTATFVWMWDSRTTGAIREDGRR